MSDTQYEKIPLIYFERAVGSAKHVIDMSSFKLCCNGAQPLPAMVGVHVNPTYRYEFLASP